ncbi:hypothetical protein J6590_033899 [Homalodisca vitripennis]|nr:hypothetical protein J6590_033899 [Homalodisca vitripennis]
MGAEEEGDPQLNLINGVENIVGDFVRGKLGKDTFEKTVLEVRKVLPSLYNFKVWRLNARNVDNAAVAVLSEVIIGLVSTLRTTLYNQSKQLVIPKF